MSISCDVTIGVYARFQSLLPCLLSMVPPPLIINFDQTNANFVPVSEWTLAKEGSKQVSIVTIDDKREMTVLLSCSMSGELLPPQLIYAGRTPHCHPVFAFPDDGR